MEHGFPWNTGVLHFQNSQQLKRALTSGSAGRGAVRLAAGDLTARDDATHQGPCIYLYSVSNSARDTPRRSRV